MFVLRALHSFAARLGDRKPDKNNLQPELARAENDSWRPSCHQGGMQRSTKPGRTNVITIIINKRCLVGLF